MTDESILAFAVLVVLANLVLAVVLSVIGKYVNHVNSGDDDGKGKF